MGQEYSELRARIAALGLSQNSLARAMKELGDNRDEDNILRSIQRMIAGQRPVSGEMRALIGLMERTKAKTGRLPVRARLKPVRGTSVPTAPADPPADTTSSQ